MAAPTLTSTRVLHSAGVYDQLYIGDVVEAGGGSFGWGVTPIAAAARVTFTQTYSTSDATIAAVTTTSPSTTLVLTATNIASKTASLTLGQSAATNPTDAQFDQAMKDIGTAFNTLRVEVAAAVADILAMKKNDNKIIDALQALGIVL